MLNMTKYKLDLMSDADVYLFFKKGMGARAFYISKRYSIANNKYLQSYDPKRESKYIIYLDANNLHGSAMSQFLPTSRFKSFIDLKEFDMNKYTTNSSKDCVL